MAQNLIFGRVFCCKKTLTNKNQMNLWKIILMFYSKGIKRKFQIDFFR